MHVGTISAVAPAVVAAATADRRSEQPAGGSSG